MNPIGWIKEHKGEAALIGVGGIGIIWFVFIRKPSGSGVTAPSTTDTTSASDTSSVGGGTWTGGYGTGASDFASQVATDLATDLGTQSGGGSSTTDQTTGTPAAAGETVAQLEGIGGYGSGTLVSLLDTVKQQQQQQTASNSGAGASEGYNAGVASVTYGSTTAQPASQTNLPTITTTQGPEYQGIGNQGVETQLKSSGYTIFARSNQTGEFVPTVQGGKNVPLPAGTTIGSGRFYNPNQFG